MSLVAYLLDRLARTDDGGASLLDRALVLYGSPMGDPNLHNHRKVPFLLAGHAGGRIRGGRHLRAADRTPLANVMLSVLETLGVELDRFGDSTGRFDLNVGRRGGVSASHGR